MEAVTYIDLALGTFALRALLVRYLGMTALMEV
jgi:hypothetical protein